MRVCDEDGEVYFASHPRIREQFDALAAEARELRRDRARLDWVLKGGPIDVAVDCGKDSAVIETRAEIDAAMGGGEGEA